MNPENQNISYKIPEQYLIAPIKTVAYDLEKYLLAHIETMNSFQITQTLQQLTAYVQSAESSYPSEIRSRIYELGSVLARACIENGIDVQSIQNLLDIANSTSLLFDASTLHRTASRMTNYFEQCLELMPQLHSNAVTVCKVQGYIARNYASKLTLDEVAGYVHLNASYFSSIFKKESGISFKEYLNRYRIMHSQKLLKTTRYSILDIAIASGFEEQSHFTKTFKKYAGITPAQYRFLSF